MTVNLVPPGFESLTPSVAIRSDAKGTRVLMGVPCEDLQKVLPFMSGTAHAKYEAAFAELDQFNSNKKWYRSTRLLNPFDMLKWSIESVVDGPVEDAENLYGHAVVSWQFNGRKMSARTDGAEGGVCGLEMDAGQGERAAVLDFAKAYAEFFTDALKAYKKCTNKRRLYTYW